MQRSTLSILGLVVLFSLAIRGMHPAKAADSDLDHRFTETIRPFVATYCVGCHSGATPAAQFDLKSFTTLAEVVHDYPHWNLVLEKLTAKEMPPKGLKQPPAEARQEVIDWI